MPVFKKEDIENGYKACARCDTRIHVLIDIIKTEKCGICDSWAASKADFDTGAEILSKIGD